MMSLFTPFDMIIYRSSFLLFSLIFGALINMTWVSNIFMKIFSHLKHLISEFFYSLKPYHFSKGFSTILFSSFFLFVSLNFLSVWPYTFAPSSQVSLVLFLSVCFWTGMISFLVFNNAKYFLAHSIPEGTPIYLTWFLFLIEMISNLIRPITLTVRLVANILAGHLLMILLSQLVLFYPSVTILYAGLNLVELFVALIQAYIFCTMICLYYSEVY